MTPRFWDVDGPGSDPAGRIIHRLMKSIIMMDRSSPLVGLSRPRPQNRSGLKRRNLLSRGPPLKPRGAGDWLGPRPLTGGRRSWSSMIVEVGAYGGTALRASPFFGGTRVAFVRGLGGRKWVMFGSRRAALTPTAVPAFTCGARTSLCATRRRGAGRCVEGPSAWRRAIDGPDLAAVTRRRPAGDLAARPRQICARLSESPWDDNGMDLFDATGCPFG